MVLLNTAPPKASTTPMVPPRVRDLLLISESFSGSLRTWLTFSRLNSLSPSSSFKNSTKDKELSMTAPADPNARGVAATTPAAVPTPGTTVPAAPPASNASRPAFADSLFAIVE